jgi:TolA-binding protein
MRTILISILILFPLNTVFSQKSISYAEKMRLFEMGKQHYTEHQYAPAKDYLTQFVKDMPESEGKLIEAKYYIATSNLFLKEKNAETELTIFINRYSESYFANQGVFVLVPLECSFLMLTNRLLLDYLQ